jgi:hypothetical protein
MNKQPAETTANSNHTSFIKSSSIGHKQNINDNQRNYNYNIIIDNKAPRSSYNKL